MEKRLRLGNQKLDFVSYLVYLPLLFLVGSIWLVCFSISQLAEASDRIFNPPSYILILDYHVYKRAKTLSEFLSLDREIVLDGDTLRMRIVKNRLKPFKPRLECTMDISNLIEINVEEGFLTSEITMRYKQDELFVVDKEEAEFSFIMIDPYFSNEAEEMKVWVKETIVTLRI